LIAPCYGITKFPENGNYAIVLNHYFEGNLREYLQKNHSKLTLKNRITIFNNLCYSLDDIHEKDLIHCDLHSGNILIQSDICFITDLGLCGPVDDDESKKIYGIVSYIAPELLRGKNNTKNTKETDVYSVGMLMWEIFSGHPPFDDRAHDHYLIFDICEGLRPPMLPKMPVDYVEMMQKCWDTDPSKRPTIGELWDFSSDKLKEIYETESENNNNNNNNNNTSLINENDFNNDYSNNNSGNSGSNSQQEHKSHPLAYHSSRILDDEIAKSKNLKSNDSLIDELDFNDFNLKDV
jgi:serine/threonine protein kinase